MNTLLVISLVLGLAWSQSSSGTIEAVYREGKEYVYNYETQVLSGLPKGSKIYSGMKVKAIFRIQFTSPTRVSLKIEEPCKIYKINDRINTDDPTRDMVPTEIFTEIIDPDLDRMKTEIFKPVTFSYIRGHITDLVTEEDDPLWSINVKKGMLSFLELNFNERQSLQSLDNPVTVEHSDLTPKFYRVIEPSVTGECETSYWVKPDITHDGQTLMKIEKVRNYDRCIDKVSFFFDMFNGRDCDFCEPNMKFHPVTAQSSVRYNIIGSPSQFVIMNAYAESQYNFVPYSERGGRITTFTNQTMTLVDSRPITTQIPEPRSPMKHEKPITGDHPEEKKSHQSLSPKQAGMMEFEKAENYKMAVKALMAYEKFSRDKVEEEAGPVMVEMRRLLRTLDKPWLEKLLKEVNSENMKNARKGLLDILPVIGTFEGADLIIDRLIKEDPVVSWPPSVFMSLALMPRPDVPTVQRLHDFIVHKKFTDPEHRRAAWLSLGSLGYKMVNMNETEEKDFQRKCDLIKEVKDKSNVKQVRRDLDKKLQKFNEQRLQKIALYNELRRKIVESVMNLMKSPNPDDIVLAIKTVGNLGFIEFFTEVKAVIVNKELPPLRRMQAIYCTRRMYKYIPEEVRRVLLPVYLDLLEAEEIRMSAYLIFMNTNPPRPDLEIIARSVPEEPSYNVGALVWSHLVALSNRTTTCNCVQSLARNTTLALRYARKFSWGLQFSNYRFYSSYDRNLEAGHSYQYAMLFNSKERLPRGFAMQYSAAFLGQKTNLMEIGMNGKGLDTYIDRLSKDAGSTSFPDVLSQLLKPRKPRSVKQGEQEIQEIKEKLKIKPRTQETTEGHIYFKLFGQELVYMDINPPKKTQDSSSQDSHYQHVFTPKDFPDSPVSSVFDSVFKFMKMFRSILYPLRHEMIVTETGLPLFVKLDVVGAWKIDTDFRLENSPLQSKALKPKDIVLDFKPSGVFQLWCEMGIDMWYFRSGVIIKPTLYLNSPLSLTFNIDPDKTKFIMTLKDEKVLNPIKIESTPMTFLRHLPPDAKRYPVYPVYKEIMIVDGVELTPFNREYGRDWFGRIISVTGKWPVPRQYNVPIFPMTGKFVMFTEYKPLNPTGWELHFQHVSENTEQYKDSQDQPSQNQGWWPFKGWFGEQNQDTVNSQELGTSQESSWERYPSEYPEQNSINLKQQDLSIQHLNKKFQTYTKPLMSGNKCGFIVRLVEPGPNPVHDVQISTFYQRDKPGLEEMYTVEIRRAPIPEVETKPWKMVADIRMTYPSTVIEPSHLFSDHYQQQIQKQIQMSVRSDDRRKDTLLDLDTLTLSQAVKHLMRLTQPSSQISTVKDIVNHLMQNMHGPESQMMNDLIQTQRHLYKEVKEFKKQPCNVKKRQQISQKFQELLDKCEMNVKKLNSKLDEIPQGQQQPEESAISHSFILSFKKTMKEVAKIQEKVRLILPPHEQISVQKKFRTIKDQFKSVRQKQEQHSISKQSQELNKSHLEVEPEQRSMYRFFLDLERQTIQASQSIHQNPDNLESAKPYMDKVMKKSEAAKEALDQSLIRDGKLCKMMRVKAFEVVLKHKLIAQDLEERLSKRNPISPSTDQPEQKMRDIKELQQKLRKLSTEISKRISFAVNNEKESSQTTEMLKQDQDDIKSLQIHEVKQLQTIEHLKHLREKMNEKQHPSDAQQSDSQITSPELEVRKVIETVQRIHESIKHIFEKRETEQKQTLSPVLIKTLKILSKHALIMDKVRQFLKQCRLQTFMNKEWSPLTSQYAPETQVYSPRFVPVLSAEQSSFSEEMKNKIEFLEKESLKLLKKINKFLSKKQPSMKHTSNEQSSEESYEISNKIPSMSSDYSTRQILQKVHKVQAHQLQQESVVQSMIKALDQEKLEKSKLFQQISDIYELVNGMTHLQKSQEEVQHDLKSMLAVSPVSKNIQIVCSQLKDSLKQQKDRTTAFERKLMEYQQGSSLKLPIQNAQQLKDQIQRLYRDQKSIEQQLKAQQSPQIEYKSQPQSWKEPEELEGLVTVHYGLEGTTMRKILMKIFGKKTIEQLLWEQQQSRLGEQDKLVRDYLEEKHYINDRLTPSYNKLKNELNKYRHWEILCAYEKETVHVGVRHLVWRLHEYLKYRFYPRTTLVMPDNTNIPNNFEVVAELRRDMRSMDMDIRTPYETTWFRNLRVPELCGMFVTPNTEAYGTHILKKFTQSRFPATCEVSYSRIKTMDQHRYEVPQLSLNCKKILSMDCSEDSKYVVMSQPSKHDLTWKDITLLTNNEKIEIVQERSGPMVKINGQNIQLDSPLSVRHEDGTIVSVEKSGKKVTVSIPKLSLDVSTDGKNTNVMVGQYYYSKVCGLCGNMDSNPSNDFEGPLKVNHPYGSTMSAVYLVPDHHCDATDIQKKLGVPDIQKQAKMIPPVQQTKVVEKTQGYVRKTCFSTQPVKRCPENTSPEGITSRLVSYHCLDSSSTATQKLVDRSHFHILDELRYKTVDLNVYESEPKACMTQ